MRSRITAGQKAKPVTFMEGVTLSSYELLLPGNLWDCIVDQMTRQGFGELPLGLAQVDSTTGMIRIYISAKEYR